MSMQSQLLDTLQQLKGKTIWSMMAGPSHGSAIGFDVGGRRKLRTPLTDPDLPEERRLYEGEYALFIQCAWRFERGGEIVCGSRSRNDRYDDMAVQLECVVGVAISEVRVEFPFFDFSLQFGDIDARLSVFCDEVDPDDRMDNFFICLEDTILVAGPKSVVRIDERNEVF
jgi:hypothetical protein